MNKAIIAILVTFIGILALFFWQVRQETLKPTNGFVDESYIVKMNYQSEEELYGLKDTQSSSEIPYFMNLSEQQLIQKSFQEVQKQVADRVNEKYAQVLRAEVDFKENTVTFGGSSYDFIEAQQTNSGKVYALSQRESASITDENLTLLVRNADSTQRERNQALWNIAWLAIGMYILFCVIGIVVLFNLEVIAHWLVNLFVRDATPGPIVAFLIGLSAVGLIVRGLWTLYLAYMAIV